MNMQNLTEFPEFMTNSFSLPQGARATQHTADGAARGFLQQPTELTEKTLALLARLSAQDESLAQALAAWQPQAASTAALS